MISLARKANPSRRRFSIDSSTPRSMQSHTKLMVEVDTKFQGDYDSEVVSALN